jgi:hypothetical protein
MALSNTVVKAVYNGNGSTTTFAIPADVIETASSEIKVYLRDESAIPNTETLQTITVDYTLTGGGPDNVEMTVAPTSNQKLLVTRELPLTQNVEYTGTNAFPADSHELALDRLAAQVQQVNERVDRTPTLLRSSPLSLPLALPEPEADKFISWNSDASGLENKAATSNTGNGTIINSGGSSTDNAIPKWVGTAGDDIQNTGVLIDDSNNISGIGNLTLTGNILANVSTTGTVTGNGFELGRRNIRDITTDAQTITVSNEYVKLSNGVVASVTLPSVDSTHDGMRLEIQKTVDDLDTITITASDTDSVGGAGSPGSIKINTYNEKIVLIYDHSNTDWMVVDRKCETNWATYTPTITHNSGSATNFTHVGKWRRDGKDIIVTGTSTYDGGGAGTYSEWHISLPGSLTVDESDISQSTDSTVIGTGFFRDIGSTNTIGRIIYNAGSNRQTLQVINATGTYSYHAAVTQAAPFAPVTNDFYNWEFRVPITDWDV